ncbi:hypothetical protein SERLA73DRAFT_75629 [Serpula lacrymans var. lacrymans S7.3]|uniref:Uncharacterized protein n=2 Tax=Serpula lacrymans var. lacrymans TaxID=341189 RepID=F8Q3R1_SERL3|nr:uncharacterized protein SERLADRAFT_440391 [Serpula lacrymans var. lacrymans S7.9]EGN96767.1 hypothetical protein SERLA73DRAFT_75629 [Serpula lacrymans var. lacrymans S7.3]EGO22371.1 hypothetical protein SERLADRAFT_440391 [Serpula lacrymans var. lacrymans S7.9]
MVGSNIESQYLNCPSDLWIIDSVSKSESSFSLHSTARKAPRISCTKYLERQVILAWKRITRSAHKRDRASFLPKDFVLVTSHRRSVLFI